MIPTVEWKDGIVRMLDQTKLPIEIVYNECKDYQTVARGIKELWVRGAPAIGVSAAMGLALGARQIKADTFDDFWPKFEEICSHHGGYPAHGGQPVLGHRPDQTVRAANKDQVP